MTRRKNPLPCTIDGCGRPIERKGLCSAHAHRLQRYGDPLGGRQLEGYIEKDMVRIAGLKTDDCVFWPYTRNSFGYAMHAGKQAHREICRLAHGEPPDPKLLCAHSCGNGHLGCVNPSHLRWATQKENMQDAVHHGTVRRGENQKSAKLTEQQVREARRLSAAGRSNPQIGRLYGVSSTTIRDLVNRTTWRHVE